MGLDRTDILIVGGGVAGLLLGWKLRERDIRILTGRFPPASIVSAGVLNPVTGRRLTAVPDFQDFLSEAERTYGGIPTPRPLFHRTAIRRFFQNDKEAALFRERRDSAAHRPYLSDETPAGESGLATSDPLGSFLIRNAGVVELPPLLEAIQTELADRIRTENAQWESLSVGRASTRLNGIEAATIVCCDGASVVRNPLFRWLPLRPVMGETLTLRASGLPPFDEVVQHGKWVLSLGNDLFRIGSTYHRIDLGGEGLSATARPDPPLAGEAGRRELAEAFARIFPSASQTEVVDHRAGIRPCSRDRLPYVGPHPALPNAFICNGLGSKGALMAPLLTETLARHIRDGAPLEKHWLPVRMVARGFEPAIDRRT